MTELFHMDGKEHSGMLNPGVVMTGKWINSRVIETAGKKDGEDAGDGPASPVCETARAARRWLQKRVVTGYLIPPARGRSQQHD